MSPPRLERIDEAKLVAAMRGKRRELIAAVSEDMITAELAPAAEPSAPPEASVSEEKTELIERNIPSHSESEVQTARKTGRAESADTEDKTTEREARIKDAEPTGTRSERSERTTIAKSVRQKAESSLFLPRSPSRMRFKIAAGEIAE